MKRMLARIAKIATVSFLAVLLNTDPSTADNKYLLIWPRIEVSEEVGNYEKKKEKTKKKVIAVYSLKCLFRVTNYQCCTE